MKKLGVLLLLALVILPIVSGADNNQSNDNLEGVDKAYQCLKDQIDAKSESSLSLKESAFGILALGSNTKLKDRLEELRNNNCWPKPSCTIEETSKALLAYDSINQNTQEIEDYLLSKNGSATGIDWYLLIDIEQHVPATCSISSSGSSSTISIDSDMKLSGNAGSCLSITPSGYWLKIGSNCLDRTFQISCDGSFSNFITTLLYQKPDSDTIYVSSNTNSAPASGTTEEKINAQCFRSGSSCDYEGTLWASLALQEAGNDVSNFIPYLTALSDENGRFFPSSFLYIVSGGSDEYYSEIVQSQRLNQYWLAPNSVENKFHDTALGLLALQSTSSDAAENAKSYLIQIQTSDGCWNNNNVGDTAFLLYSGWPRSSGTTSGTGNGTTSLGDPDCEDAGLYCGSILQCDDALGTVNYDYDCPLIGDFCCSAPITEESCSAKGGEICSITEDCSGTEVNSLTGDCCLGSCIPSTSVTESECETEGGTCSSSCFDNEEEANYNCEDSADVCCMEASSTSGGSGLWIWITVLIILIILVALGIVYRKKLQIFMYRFRRKRKTKSSPLPPTQRPSFRRPTSPPGRAPSRQAPPHPHKGPSKLDKEMEETLKKLREMSK